MEPNPDLIPRHYTWAIVTMTQLKEETVTHNLIRKTPILSK